MLFFFFFFQAEDGIRDFHVTGVQTCALPIFWVKENNSYSENYDIVTAQNFIRRGPKSYLATCTPANFPLTAETAVARVSVSFFRIANCPSGTTIPLLGLNQLPIGCVATITATPRDAVGNKL